MRMLFTFAGGSGHFEPLIPFARAAMAAGHTVVVAGQPVLAPAIKAAGFTAIATDGATLSAAPERKPLLTVDMAREYHDLREGFARRLARKRAAAVTQVITSWQPDLLVCDEIDFGAMIAAENQGLPYAVVLVIAAGSFVRVDELSAPLNELRAEYGLPPDPELAMLTRHLVLSPFPPMYRDPQFPLPATAHAFRPAAAAPAATTSAPSWEGQLDGAPLVYFTLGTVFNVESGDLFERVLAGLRALPINVIATVGPQLDPAIFQPQPANIQLARYVPQAEVLPHCAAVVSHGGSGSVLGALAHGVPMVLLPMGADQPLNAARCQALGVAEALDVTTLTPADVSAAVSNVLADQRYRYAAALLRDDIATLPDAADALPLLMSLMAR